MRHIFALSNILGFPIQTLYPDVRGSLVDRNYVNVPITPSHMQHSSVAYVMWTHTRNVDLHGWTPNHFVPLLPVPSVMLLLKRAFYLVNFLVDNSIFTLSLCRFLVLLSYFVLVIFDCWQLSALFKLLHYFSNCTILVSIATECYIIRDSLSPLLLFLIPSP